MLRLSQAAQGKGARNCVGNRVGMREIGGFADCGAGKFAHRIPFGWGMVRGVV